MNKIYIMCVDDESDVLEAVERELIDFEDLFPIETADTASEARDLFKSIHEQGDQIGLILCDHVMPGEQGVELLVAMEEELSMQHTRKVLLTGQAGLEATINAVNQGNLNYYIAKPWDKETLVKVVSDQLTDYLLNTKQDLKPYLKHLNTVKALLAIHDEGLVGDD